LLGSNMTVLETFSVKPVSFNSLCWVRVWL